jgi:hypothetical protein
MKQNVLEKDFVRAFEESSYNKNFSKKGLVSLFAHLEELEDQIGEEIELDLVAIASDYTEYLNWSKIERDFNNIITPEMSPESKLKALKKHIEVEIVVVDLDEGDIIFHSF